MPALHCVSRLNRAEDTGMALYPEPIEGVEGCGVRPARSTDQVLVHTMGPTGCSHRSHLRLVENKTRNQNQP